MYIHEVESILKKAAPTKVTKKHFDPQKYMGTQFQMLGIAAPRQREIFKTGFSFSQVNLADQLYIWDDIWKNAQLFEVLNQALFFAEKNVNKINGRELMAVLETWLEKVDNWGHSDLLSAIFTKILIKDPDLVFPKLKAWNQAPRPWYNRQSIVPLAMYYRSNALVPFTKSIMFIKNLLTHEDYFVQKGVGWSLREIGTKYPQETWDFLNKNIHQISSTAFSATIEKLTPTEKEKLKTMRRKK
jgi:3-methyladenine DNA glycosylase AlkD